MKIVSTLLTSAMLASLSPIHVFAKNDIENIVVVGARVPIQKSLLSGSVTIIDSLQIEASKAVDVVDLLRGLAGISVSQSGGKGSLNELRVRGSESNHVLVLIDGVAVNDLGQSDLANFAHISLANIERIEVLRGSQSALWGSGAIGGVINIISKQGTEDFSSDFQAEYGQSSSHKLAANAQGKTGELKYALSANQFKTAGQNISREGGEKDAYENTLLGINAKWQASQKSDFQLNLRYTDARNEFDNFQPADADKYTEVEQLSGKAVWHYQDKDNNWNQQLGLHLSKNQNISFGDGLFESGNKSKKQRLYWQNQLLYSDSGSATLVLEHVSEDFEQSGLASFFGDPNQSQNNNINSVVLDVLHEFSSKFSVHTSLRHDNNSEYDNANSHRVGVNYRPNVNIKLFSSYGRSIKNPTFTEIFGFTPASFIGNPDLEPEQSSSWELGGEMLLNQDWQAEMTYFDTELEGEIQTVFSSDFSSSSAVNLDQKSKRKGIELGLRGQVGALKTNISYGYVDAKQADQSSVLQREPRRAKHTGNVSFNYLFADDKVNVYLQASYQGEQLDTDFNTFPAASVSLGGYTLVNTALSYHLSKHSQLYIRGENVFDKEYEDVFSYRGLERRIYLGVKHKFN
jgi:vitamin B12 transporter